MAMHSSDIRNRTFNFALSTVKACNKLRYTYKEHVLTNQLTRSSTSIGANMREVRNAESKADFIHKLSVCQKECDESIYGLESLSALIPEKNDLIKPLLKEAGEILKIIRTINIRVKAGVKGNHS